MQASSVINRVVRAELLRGKADRRPVEVELSYDTADPYAVQLAIIGGDAQASWAIGRDLLAEGVTRPVGEGEARVWPSPFGLRPVAWVRFGQQRRTALIEFALDDLRRFLDQAYQLVPVGSEPLFVDVDGLIDELIRDAS